MPPPPRTHDGVFLILHPVHFKRGTNPHAANLSDIARSPSVAREVSGLALQMKDGTLRVLKSRSGLVTGGHPSPDKEVTVELTPKGRLLVVRGNPSRMAEATIDRVRKAWKLQEPDKYNDNCERCGSWVQHSVIYVQPSNNGVGVPDAHMAPCGLKCAPHPSPDPSNRDRPSLVSR